MNINIVKANKTDESNWAIELEFMAIVPFYAEVLSIVSLNQDLYVVYDNKIESTQTRKVRFTGDLIGPELPAEPKPRERIDGYINSLRVFGGYDAGDERWDFYQEN